MERRLTELEKSLLLAFLAITKGQAKYVREDELVMKFPAVQRKFVRKTMEKLSKNSFLLKRAAGKSYMLSEKGVKSARRALLEGVRII